MGIIQRQSLKFTIINLLGVGVGVVSTLFVYPLITSEFGFIRYLQELSLLALPLLSTGMALTSIKFYPEFKEQDEEGHGLLGITLLVASVSVAFWSIAATLLWPWLLSLSKSDLQHRDLLWMVVPFSILTTFTTILYNYTQNTHRIAFPSLIVDVAPKFLTPIILISYWKNWIPFQTAMTFLLIVMGLSLAALALFLKKLGALHLKINKSILTPNRLRRFFEYAGFVTLFGLVYILATRMDVIFLGSMTSFATTGAYAIVVFMVSTIEIPTKGLYLASYGKLPAFWLENDLRGMEELLGKVTLNLIAAGSAILFLLLLNLPFLAEIMPNGHILLNAVPLAALLGTAKLADATGGMSHAIMYFSNKYKWALLSLSILALLNLVLSFWLIPIYGTLGAALVTALTVVSFNSFSILFCRVVWGIRLPFLPLAKCLCAAMLSAIVAYLIPDLANPYVNIVLKSGVFLLMNGWMVFQFALAPDLIEMVKSLVKKVGSR